MWNAVWGGKGKLSQEIGLSSPQKLLPPHHDSTHKSFSEPLLPQIVEFQFPSPEKPISCVNVY